MKHVFVLLIWTCICIFADILIIKDVNKTLTYEIPGEWRTTISSRYVITTSTALTVSGVSSDYFLITNDDLTDKIQGDLSKPPLGWKYDKYYCLSPKTISPGNWTIQIIGAVDFQISSESPTTITLEPTEDQKGDTMVIVIFITVLVWILISAIYYAIVS